MSKHTPAPWLVTAFSSTITDNKAKVILSAAVSKRPYFVDKANAEHAAAAVNFVDGFEIENLPATYKGANLKVALEMLIEKVGLVPGGAYENPLVAIEAISMRWDEIAPFIDGEEYDIYHDDDFIGDQDPIGDNTPDTDDYNPNCW